MAAARRFLVAETESGYTLLAALWLARLFGCERNIEISPLFETGEALESGGRVLDEALRVAALARLPARDRAAVPAIRLLRQRALRRATGGVVT